MPITKLEAAQRQLDCAIRLFFNEDDLASVITLSRAAFRLLYDLYPNLTTDGFDTELGKVIARMGWHKFNHIANQLKHADKDPDVEIEPDPVHAMTGIGLAAILYRRGTGKETPETFAFEAWMGVLQPDVFAGKPDPTAEGYSDFVKAVEYYMDAGHEARMKLGRSLLAEVPKHKKF
jgi:hypothetical protein